MSAELEALIRAEIERTGPLTFARFMELALYHPGLGYYTSPVARPTREGDFLTAPELHPIFGHAVARQVNQVWERLGRPARFDLIEFGAGSGALAVALMAGLEADRSALREALAYAPVEVNPHRIEELHRKAAEGGWERQIQEARIPQSFTGCVLANEFLDALPVHRLEWSSGRLHEIRVGLDSAGRFCDVPAEPDRALAGIAGERFAAGGREPTQGQRFEVCPGLEEWLHAVSGPLEAGLVLVLDYGHAASDLYAAARSRGTVRVYAHHDVSDDPYDSPGDRDITAHVDLSAVGRLAVASGLDVLGEVSQAQFLLGCGLEDLLGAARDRPDLTMPDYLALRSSIRRLLDPRGLGAFRVLMLGRGIEPEPPLRGLRPPPLVQ